MQTLGALGLGLALALVASCGGGGGGSVSISDQPLSGKIGGQPWTLVTAETDAYQSTNAQYVVDAYSESFTPCSGSASLNADAIYLNFPTAVGTYRVSINMIQTLYVAATNHNYGATSGQIVISDVTATTISGGASFAYDADNSVDGQFQATICP